MMRRRRECVGRWSFVSRSEASLVGRLGRRRGRALGVAGKASTPRWLLGGSVAGDEEEDEVFVGSFVRST